MNEEIKLKVLNAILTEWFENYDNRELDRGMMHAIAAVMAMEEKDE